MQSQICAPPALVGACLPLALSVPSSYFEKAGLHPNPFAVQIVETSLAVALAFFYMPKTPNLEESMLQVRPPCLTDLRSSHHPHINALQCMQSHSYRPQLVCHVHVPCGCLKGGLVWNT